jgi:16S rRNA (guanine966-N2)-methyltransferase
VLDLFAGSGSLGFEALSRGAARVVFVEDARPVAKLIEKNARTLNVLDRIEILTESVDRIWKRLTGGDPFDLVLADPPYSAGWEMKLLENAPWEPLLREDGYFVIEWGTVKSQVAELPESVPFLVKTREKNYGDSVLTTYLRTAVSGAALSGPSFARQRE